jgi:hypothetical protein
MILLRRLNVLLFTGSGKNFGRESPRSSGLTVWDVHYFVQEELRGQGLQLGADTAARGERSIF